MSPRKKPEMTVNKNTYNHRRNELEKKTVSENDSEGK